MMLKFRNKFKYKVTLAAATILLIACGQNGSRQHDADAHGAGRDLEQEPHSAEHDETHAGKSAGHGDHHEGHGHESGEDLEQSVDELFSRMCEHNIRTYECDECRYEVGVAKVNAELLKEGLMKVIRPLRKAVAIPLRLTGEIQFDDRQVAHVSTQVGGVIRKVHVTLGDAVTEGQPLVEIESMEVGNAKAVYQEAQATRNLAEQSFDRVSRLKTEGIASQKELLQAEQELEAARIRVTAARGMLQRLGMTGSSKQGVNPGGSSGKLTLRAGKDGTVLNMHAVVGEVVKADETLVTIGQNSSLWVWADLYENDYARVAGAYAAGSLDAEVRVRAFPDRHFAGKVDYISPSMNEVSRTVKVRVVLPNPGGVLLSGMFADVDIFLPGNEQATILPGSAVLLDEGRTFVFVHHQDDYYVRRPVQTGRRFGDEVEILSGVNDSQKVVANGAFLLKSDVLRSKMGAGCAH